MEKDNTELTFTSPLFLLCVGFVVLALFGGVFG